LQDISSKIQDFKNDNFEFILSFMEFNSPAPVFSSFLFHFLIDTFSLLTDMTVTSYMSHPASKKKKPQNLSPAV